MNQKVFVVVTALMAILSVSTYTPKVQADDDDSFVNYDSIVSDLKMSADTEPRPAHEELDWDEVALSGGLSLAGSFVNFSLPTGGSASGMLKGFEAHLGFNLFSKVARAEAAFSNYGQETLAANTIADMREYEMRLVFLPFLQDKLLMRMGGSLSERSISLHANGNNSINTQAYYSLLLGAERKVSNNVSFGPDIAYHSPFDTTSTGRSSWDTSVRLNATF